MTPYRDAANALWTAYGLARHQRRPHAEQRTLEHAAQLCQRLAQETGEDTE